MFKYLITPLIFTCSQLAYSQDFGEQIGNILLSGYSDQITGIGTMKSNLKQGKWTFYSNVKDSLQYAEGKFVDDKKQGTWKTYFPDRYHRVRSTEYYRNDSLIEVVYFNDSGDSIIRIKAHSALSPEVTQELSIRSYHFPKMVTVAITQENKSPEDAHRDELAKIISLLQSHNQSAYLTFWEFGEVLTEDYTIKGPEITKTRYERNFGKIYRTSQFHNGILEREKQIVDGNPANFDIRLYHPSGKLSEVQHYSNHSEKTGKWQSFYPSGEKKLFASYKNGQLHGTLKEWAEDGTLIRDESYANGSLKQ